MGRWRAAGSGRSGDDVPAAITPMAAVRRGVVGLRCTRASRESGAGLTHSPRCARVSVALKARGHRVNARDHVAAHDGRVAAVVGSEWPSTPPCVRADPATAAAARTRHLVQHVPGHRVRVPDRRQRRGQRPLRTVGHHAAHLAVDDLQCTGRSRHGTRRRARSGRGRTVGEPGGPWAAVATIRGRRPRPTRPVGCHYCGTEVRSTRARRRPSLPSGP